MKNFVVLYRDKSSNPLQEPFGFQCFAEDVDHAEEQCENAYPEVDIVWVWEGIQGVGMQDALDDYYAAGELK